MESFFYYLSKKYNKNDITIYYTDGDYWQLHKLRKYARVKQYHKGEKIKCEKLFLNYNVSIIDDVEADEYIQIIHTDYKAAGLPFTPNPKITKFIGVSQEVCKGFKELTGKDIECIYNPIILEKTKKVLRLISATRLTAEKGGERIKQLAEILNSKGIPFQWLIYTNDTGSLLQDIPGIIILPAKREIIDMIAASDYLVQLSDNEAYCYSVVEALSIGTPVIVTACPVFKELGLKDGANSYILDFDLKNVDVEKIYKNIPKVKFTPPEDKWGDILAPGENTYEAEKKKKVKVQCIQGYNDVELNKTKMPDDKPYMISKPRAEELEWAGLVEIVRK